MDEQKKKDLEESSNLLYEQVDSYFQFKKNLLIQEVMFFNRDILETPDIICIMAAESLYNAHTGRLIVAGGSSQGFYSDVKNRYNVDANMDIRLNVLTDAIIAAKGRDLIEFISEGMSIQDHLTAMVEESEVKLKKFVDKSGSEASH